MLAGAHLDSVPAGPGINDDGSGTAWQLELAEQIAKLGIPPRNKIRFMWFGGEEDGLVGSQYYADNLSQREVDKIDVMIDTDMIASPNYVRLVYDGDGDELGPAGPAGLRRRRAVFKRYFARARHGHPAAGVRRPLGLRRLHQPRHPVGRHLRRRGGSQDAEQVALFGGVAGEQYDPCYHEACDNIDTVTGQPPAETMNVVRRPTRRTWRQQQADSLNGNALKSLREMSGAVTHAVWYFARVKGALPPRAN